jgi:hypothetical protein
VWQSHCSPYRVDAAQVTTQVSFLTAAKEFHVGVFGRRIFPILGIAGVAFLVSAGSASAGMYDLTDGSATTLYTVHGGLFTTDYQHPTGTGVIDSFLRLQQKGSEEGYNTSARSYPLPAPGPKTQFDEISDPNFTRNLLTSEIETINVDGKDYFAFFLDINEPAATVGSKYLITLDQLEIYVSDTPNLDAYSSTGPNNGSGSLGLSGGPASMSTKIYDLDTASTDNWVNLDYLVEGQGSGSSDMVFLLDASLFAGYDYVYLYSQFGDATADDLKKVNGRWQTVNDYKYPSQAGFEEWFTAAGSPTPPGAPEPATLLLLGSGLAVGLRRRFRCS